MENTISDQSALLRMIISMLIYGTIGIFRRHIPLSSGIIACARGLIGSAFLALFLAVRGKKIKRTGSGKQLLLLILTGAMIGFNWILLFEAYNYTTVAVATLCYYMQPVIVIAAAPFLFGERLDLRRKLCVAAALLGMVLISGIVENGIPAVGELKGILLGLGAALLYASVVLTNKRITGVDIYEKTITQLLSAALVLIPYLLVTEDLSAIKPDAASLGLLLTVGIVHTGIAYALYFGSIEHLRARTSALLSYIDPVTAILLSSLLLGERMTIWGITGAVLVLGSTIISEWRTKEENTTG